MLISEFTSIQNENPSSDYSLFIPKTTGQTSKVVRRQPIPLDLAEA